MSKPPDKNRYIDFNKLPVQLPFYSSTGGETHSIGIRPHPKGLAAELLSKANVEPERFKEPDNRPLIDQFHEATFHDGVGLQWIKDKYKLRSLIRKAHCFELDDDTSAMVADFSVAIARDLEASRRLAIPPFPVTWIDINNRKRLERIKQLNVDLTPTARGEVAGPPVERVGWLIFPGDDAGWNAFYVTIVGQGVMMAPLAFFWHCGNFTRSMDLEADPEADALMAHLALGYAGSNVSNIDTFLSITSMHIDSMRLHKPKSRQFVDQIRDLMTEIAGELRHIWGFLIAMGAGQFGVQTWMSEPKKDTEIRTMPNGKPLLPLEHKILHLHLNKKLKPKDVIARTWTHHKHRWHEVRGHWRTLRNKDGTTRMVPVRPHERGDEKLGRIEKTYKVER